MPRGELGKMYCNHLASMFSNMAIVFGVIYLLAASLIISGPLMVVLTYVLLSMAVIASLGILLLVPGFMEMFQGGTDIYNQLIAVIKIAAPYAFAVIAVLTVAAIVLYVLDRRRAHTGRIVGNAVLLVLSLLALILTRKVEGTWQ